MPSLSLLFSFEWMVGQIVPRQSQSFGQISVFQGKKAALNLAIFIVLFNNSLIIYDITKKIQEQKQFNNLKPSAVGRRIRNLIKKGYLEVAGKRDTKPGPKATLYRLTTKAQVALYYNMVSREMFLKEANEEALTAELAALKLFLKTAQKLKSANL